MQGELIAAIVMLVCAIGGGGLWIWRASDRISRIDTRSQSNEDRYKNLPCIHNPDYAHERASQEILLNLVKDIVDKMAGKVEMTATETVCLREITNGLKEDVGGLKTDVRELAEAIKRMSNHQGKS